MDMEAAASLALREGGEGMETRAAMIQQAKQELHILESHQPNKFKHLKLEIHDFISFLESNNLNSLASGNSSTPPVSTSSSATTQASSTSRKKRKKSSCHNVNCLVSSKQKLSNYKMDSCGFIERKDRIDEVLRRAQACLHKIQQFKQQTFVDFGK